MTLLALITSITGLPIAVAVTGEFELGGGLGLGAAETAGRVLQTGTDVGCPWSFGLAGASGSPGCPRHHRAPVSIVRMEFGRYGFPPEVTSPRSAIVRGS